MLAKEFSGNIAAQYWENPQFLIKFDSSRCTGDMTLLAALMQKEKPGSISPLAIEYDLFKVGNW